MTFGWQGVTKKALEFPDAAGAGEPFVGFAPIGRGRIRYNRALDCFEMSTNGSTYVPFGKGSGAPGGPSTSLQFNNAGVFAGDASLEFDGTSLKATNVICADGGVDTTGAAALDLAENNATSVTIGASGLATTAITMQDGVLAGFTLRTTSFDYVRVRTDTETIEFGDVSESVNYIFQGGGTFTIGTSGGGENSIRYSPALGDPVSAGLGQTYTKAVTGVAELFYIDSSGAVVQLTSGGSIAAVDGVAMVDNSATAFEVREAAIVYLAVSTIDGSESFTAGGNANLASSIAVDQGGVTAVIVDSVADSFKVEDTTGASYLAVDTSDGAERVTISNSTTNAPLFIDGSGGLQFSNDAAQTLDVEKSADEVAGVSVTFSAGDGGDDAGAASGNAGTTNLTGATGGDGAGNVSGNGGDTICAGGNAGADGGGGLGFPGNLRLRGGTGDFDGSIHIGDANTDGIGFLGATPVSRPNVTGSRAGNAALADLLTDLALLGLITDSSSA